jgi:glycosyltransferase involved in cell wall biosynthesis
MANIGFIQHRLSRTDGVSLEVDKWRSVLEAAGHTVHYLAGNPDVRGGQHIPELFPMHPVTNKILRNATRELADYPDGAALLADVRAHADLLKPGFRRFLADNRIDLVFPNNLCSVGFNLPGNLALCEVLAETGVAAVCHNHDFWWEESGEVYPTCPEVVAFYGLHSPPVLPNVGHVVINRIARAELLARKGVEATVVPNVFDFRQPDWVADDYNRDFRAAIGLAPGDLYFLQATRILDRKGVELAIDLIAELRRPENRARLESRPLFDGRAFGPGNRIVLVCAGYVEAIGLSGSYRRHLVEKAAALGVEIIWCADRVRHSRATAADGSKIYSLWDSYVEADFVTYPSYWEGWGNQLIEAVFARKPVVLFEYPVYVSDLRAAEFEVVSLGESLGAPDARGLVTVPRARLESAAAEVIALLQDPVRRAAAAEHNFHAAKELYSFQALEKILRGIFSRKGLAWE